MLTVPEAARRIGRNPETVRRWIRAGRLPARKVGTQHVIEERDLDTMLMADEEDVAFAPEEWGWDRDLQRLIVGMIRDDRDRGH